MKINQIFKNNSAWVKQKLSILITFLRGKIQTSFTLDVLTVELLLKN
jgi:uncharacterized membrane protein YwzB